MRSWMRRNRFRLTVAAVFTVLGGNVVIHDGATVLFVLILAALGCAATWAISAGVTSYSAARHAKQTERTIAAEVEARRRKELTR